MGRRHEVGRRCGWLLTMTGRGSRFVPSPRRRGMNDAGYREQVTSGEELWSVPVGGSSGVQFVY